MPRITFKEAGDTFIDVEPETNLMSAIIKAGLPIGSSCSAIGICAKCFVRVLDGMQNLSKVNPVEKKLLEREKLPQDFRISCQTKVKGDVKITTSYW